MIIYTNIMSAIVKYKEYFPKKWPEERYKWEAIKQFQDNWDIDNPDFVAMLKKALMKTGNLLSSGYAYPRKMIEGMAEVDPQTIKSMFIELYDESKDLAIRIESFRNSAEEVRKKHNKGPWKNHFQNTNAITTYLWLMYPDKYYIYKYELYKKTSEVLDDTYRPMHKGSSSDVINGFKMYDEICSYIQKDEDLRQMLDSVLTDKCYKDTKLRTMTIDFGFFIARYYKNDESEWSPSQDEYTPEMSKEQWLELLNSGSIIGPVWGGALAAFYEVGGAATCTQIANRYNKTAPEISGICTNLAKRIHKETNCPLYIDENEQKRYWSILFQGKDADSKTEGGYIWKLRPELFDALTEFNIMRYKWKSTDYNTSSK